MFRETYFDDASGTLGKVGASVRARVRFDNNEPFTVRRVLVQAKEGREVDAKTGRSIVHKFEKRWEGERVTEQMAQNALMTGKDGSSVLPVSQKLYKLAADGKALPADGMLPAGAEAHRAAEASPRAPPAGHGEHGAGAARQGERGDRRDQGRGQAGPGQAAGLRGSPSPGRWRR